MGFLDSLGDFATGAIDTHLARLEDEARKKHELALTEKAMEQRTTDQWMQDHQQRKMAKIQGDYSAAEAAAKRKAERESEEGKQKWEREKLTTEEAGRDRRASMRANAPKGNAPTAKPTRLEKITDEETGNITWVDPTSGRPRRTMNSRGQVMAEYDDAGEVIDPNADASGGFLVRGIDDVRPRASVSDDQVKKQYPNARKAPNGKWYVQQDGQWMEVEAE